MFEPKLHAMTSQFSKDQISSIIERFEQHRLPRSEWTHQAHLIVAIWYCYHYAENKALNTVRMLIIKHNESVGTPNTDDEGYHETLTIFWLKTARSYIVNRSSEDVFELCNSFLGSAFADKMFPMSFYSKEVLFSVKARHQWVTPDLRELAQIGALTQA